MKKLNSFLPLIIASAGILLLCMGTWQLADSKLKTEHSLKEAKKVVREQIKWNLPDKSKKKFKAGYGETIGVLRIPRIKSELAIVEGTDPNDLEKGVGHYKGSFYPGENGQIVLSGHRDTVFRHLGELKIGDFFNVEMPYGKFTYEIFKTKIVDANDTSIITLQNREEELIVTTCYPFRYVGNAPKRYILYAKEKKH